MKKMKLGGLVMILLAASLVATPAMAQDAASREQGVSSAGAAARDTSKFGIGIGAGTVAAGLSMKKLLGDSLAFQGVLGSWRGYGRHWHISTSSLALGADVLIEQPPLFSNEAIAMGWNAGVGAGIGFWGDATVFGATGILGLEFNFVPVPIDFVVEYRPGIYIGAGYGESDATLSFVDFTGHLRVWF